MTTNLNHKSTQELTQEAQLEIDNQILSNAKVIERVEIIASRISRLSPEELAQIDEGQLDLTHRGNKYAQIAYDHYWSVYTQVLTKIILGAVDELYHIEGTDTTAHDHFETPTI